MNNEERERSVVLRKGKKCIGSNFQGFLPPLDPSDGRTNAREREKEREKIM